MCGVPDGGEAEAEQDLDDRMVEAVNYYLRNIVKPNMTAEEMREVSVDHFIQEFCDTVKQRLSELKDKIKIDGG